MAAVRKISQRREEYEKDPLWRGLLAIALSLTVALSSLTGVAATWRTTIDSLLGTASTVTTTDDKFTSIYKTTDELVAAHMDLWASAWLRKAPCC